MAKKKSRNAPVPQNPPCLQGDVFATFIDEASKIGNEVAARRRFDAQVSAYLKEKGLVEDFEAWRLKRSADRA